MGNLDLWSFARDNYEANLWRFGHKPFEFSPGCFDQGSDFSDLVLETLKFELQLVSSRRETESNLGPKNRSPFDLGPNRGTGSTC